MNEKEKKNMGVKTKLVLISVVQIAALIVVAVAGMIVVNAVNKKQSARYNNYGLGSWELAETISNINKVKVSLRNAIYLYENEPEAQAQELATITAGMKTVNEKMDSFGEKLDNYSKEIADDYKECKVKIESYETVLNRIVSYITSNNLSAAKSELRGDGVKVAVEAGEMCDVIVQKMNAAALNESDSIHRQVVWLTAVIIITCIVVAIIAIVMCAKTIVSISVPIDSLRGAAKKMAEGEVDISLKKLKNDELGELMDDFDEMIDAIKDQAVIAERVASGDLTADSNPRSNRDVLGIALKKLLEDNNSILGNINDATNQVSVGAGEVAAASQSLAQGATEQASALQEVTASINEITERTKLNAKEANEADGLMHDVKDMALSGNEYMKSMIGAMNDINTSSETISKIIKTIDDIAFQTNILALNAAVEAARAGEHGKGFAVVAGEVRNLAAKSASAASETADMIEDSILKVGTGTKLAEETAKSLNEIVNSIDKVSDLVSAIATSSNDQAIAVEQIDQAIKQVSQVVQTNSATSEECAAASEELSGQANNLKRLMSHYTLKSNGSRQNSDITRESDNNISYTPNNYNEKIISLTGDFGKY